MLRTPYRSDSVPHRLPLRAAISAILIACAASAASADAPIDEIVVTATRRDTSIQDIPYSITAVSSKALEDSHVESFSDLAKVIAGISFVDQGPTSRSNFVLRGINANGTDHPSTSTVAPVSTYIGETPLFISLHLDDLDRVEVLRGPQGTLYGSGSLAGTIRFIPKEPDIHAFHGNLEADGADVAETNQFNHSFKGAVNLPVSDIAALRVSAGYQHYAGFINENYIVKLGAPSTADKSPVGIPVSADPANPLLGPMAFTPIRHANTANLWQARAAFLVKPSDDLSLLFAAYHQEDRSSSAQAISPNFSGSVDSPPADNPFYSPGYPVSFPTGGVVFPHNGTYDANNSFLLKEHRQATLLSADVSYNLGFATVSSSTSGYRDSGEYITDNTGLLTLYPSFYGFIPRMVDFQTNSDSLRGFVEEIRLVSRVGRKFDYVAGVFFQHLEGYNDQDQWIPGQTAYGTLVGDPGANAANLGDYNYDGVNKTGFKDRALFGELTYHLTDALQLTGGARVFKQDFSLSSLSGLPFCGSYCGDALGNSYVDQGYSVNNHIVKFNAAYKLDDAINVYFNYAEGFRRGGSSDIPTAGPFAGNPALLVYTPDKTKNFELGSKGTLGNITFSAAVFYIHWDNFQVDATAAASALPIAVNGSTARSKGVELELAGTLVERLTYDLGYSYANATVARDFSVTDFNTSQQPVQIVTGRSGDPLPNAPKTSLTLSLNYQNPVARLPGGGVLDWHLNGSYRSATESELASVDPLNPPPFKIAGFQVWNASVTLSAKSGFYTGLYAQNIFNVLGITGGQDRGAVGVRAEHFFVGRPRTVGLRAGYRF